MQFIGEVGPRQRRYCLLGLRHPAPRNPNIHHFDSAICRCKKQKANQKRDLLKALMTASNA
jgi:hypothetical protein